MNCFLESQAWWNTDGLSLNPLNPVVGRHIHLGTSLPINQAVVGNLPLDLRLVFHDQPSDAKLNRIRIMNSKGRRFWDKTTGLPTIVDDVPVIYPVILNFSGLSGWQELRFSAMVTYSNGDRQFQSTGWNVYAGSQISGTLPRDITARGWYTNHGYANPTIYSTSFQYTAVSGIWKPRVKMRPGSGGLRTKEHIATIDPNFHVNYAGTVIKYGTGSFDNVISVDTKTLTNGPHKLVLISSDGFNAGTLVVPFVVNN